MSVLTQLGKKIKRARNLGFGRTISILYGNARRKLNLLPNVPPTLYVELTSHCNLDCAMCDRLGMTRQNGLMEMSLFKKIIDNAAEIGVPNVKLNRFGESLLHPNLIEMIQYCKKKRIPWTYFTSNGTLLTKEKSAELIDSGLDSITISFDGATKETYEVIRLNAKFEEVKENIRNFIKIRNEMGKTSPKVVINTILSKETESDIYEVFKLWDPYVDKVNVIPVGRYGNVENLSSIERGKERQGKRPCHHIFDRLLIFWDGTATVCCADINGDLSVGNINDSSIEELWKNEAFMKIREKHLQKDFVDYPVCLKCDGIDAPHFNLMQEQRKAVYTQAARMGYKNLS